MKIKTQKYESIDYIFWFLFILFSDPGGIFQALGEDSGKAGSIDMRDFIFALLFGCFFIVSYKGEKIKNRTYQKVIKLLIVFGLYYFIIFGFFVPLLKDTSGYSTFEFLKKSRKTVYSLLMFAIVYRFYLRSYVLFFKTLVLSSILILTLFFITFLTGIEILPVSTHNRGFIDVDRVFIANEGLMQTLIPMGAVVLIFKSKMKWRKIMILSFFMMFINYLLSITRRDIIGTFIYLLITMILYNYIRKLALIPIKKIISVSFYLIIFGFFISLSFPKYLEAGVAGLNESINIVKYGETTSGKEDVRMGLGKDFMQNLIISNIWFGTGFDIRWRGSGDKQGYETSDYPFLSAIAMTGIFGILIFLPIYIILIKALVFDIKFLRKRKINFQSYESFGFIVFIVYFCYELIQYMNWFLPVSLSRSPKWYILFALYLASRQIFFEYYSNNKKNTTIDLKRTQW